jgi:hypothetical protein
MIPSAFWALSKILYQTDFLPSLDWRWNRSSRCFPCWETRPIYWENKSRRSLHPHPHGHDSVAQCTSWKLPERWWYLPPDFIANKTRFPIRSLWHTCTRVLATRRFGGFQTLDRRWTQSFSHTQFAPDPTKPQERWRCGAGRYRLQVNRRKLVPASLGPLKSPPYGAHFHFTDRFVDFLCHTSFLSHTEPSIDLVYTSTNVSRRPHDSWLTFRRDWVPSLWLFVQPDRARIRRGLLDVDGWCAFTSMSFIFMTRQNMYLCILNQTASVMHRSQATTHTWVQVSM